MDWAKAKNILIIAFILTNLLLIYVLVDTKDLEDPTLKVEFIKDVKNMLLEKNININCEIPKTTPSLPLLTVEYESYDPHKLADRFFKDYSRELNEDSFVFKSEAERLIVKNRKEIEYENNSNTNKYDKITKSNIDTIIRDFLIDKGFSVDDYVLDSIKEDNGTYYVKYNKKYKDIVIESSYMDFKIDNSGVKKFSRLWINPLGLDDNGIKVSSAPRALLRLISIEEVYGKSIERIDLSYYFSPKNHSSIGDLKDAKQAKAIPAWRITFDDGSKEFLEEY